jgi:hypothetical protein
MSGLPIPPRGRPSKRRILRVVGARCTLRASWSGRGVGRPRAGRGRCTDDGHIAITLLGDFTVRTDGRMVPASEWNRRSAAGIVKLLSLAPARRLHREQLIDLLWPDDTIDEALPKLHKAAHFARRAIGAADSIVLRDEHVTLCPGHEVTVDVVQFDELARRAITSADGGLARAALTLYRGDLLPKDRYEEWAEERREQLRLRRSTCCGSRGAGKPWSKPIDRRGGERAPHAPLRRSG